MRPLGVTIVALLNWLRACLWGLLGAGLIVAGHLSGRFAAFVGSGELVQRMLSGVGKGLGVAVLLVALLWLAAGWGAWTLKSWGRSLTIALTGLALVVGLLGLLHHPFPTHILRVVIDGAILIYLYTHEVQRLFHSA
jgi:hypothetical protein